jgi:hypothetical protein
VRLPGSRANGPKRYKLLTGRSLSGHSEFFIFFHGFLTDLPPAKEAERATTKAEEVGTP